MNQKYQGKKQTFWQIILPALMMFALTASSYGALPPAGFVIGNQASATYDDASGQERSVTSNLVETTIQQVAAVTLAPPTNSLTSGVGGQVFFPHSVTNNGNGTDFFNLTAVDDTTGDFALSGILIYADSDSDGIPDDLASPITFTPSLVSGETFNFVVGGTVPGTAGSNDKSTVDVTAISNFDSNVTDGPSKDTVTVSNNAVINVTKSITPNTGAAGSSGYTVTLRYTNSGNTAALDVVLTDTLPAGMSYIANSGRWSVTGPTVPLTDDPADGYEQGSTGERINYDGLPIASDEVIITLESVPVSFSGEVTFQVSIDSGLAPGDIFNFAEISYDDGSGTTINSNSNSVPFTVTTTLGVTISDGATIASTTQGSTVSFTNTVTNTGNGTDTFNITLSPDGTNPFPSGTSFVLYKDNGTTPLTDTNSDGIPDTGPVSGNNGTYDVVVKATLPPGANGTGPYIEVVTATSVTDNTVNDTGTDELSAISTNVVDLTNNAVYNPAAPPAAPGQGIGPEGTAVITNTANPGAVTIFNLHVNNLSATPDRFNLSVDSATPLPAGWSVVFKNASGTVITATDLLNGGASSANLTADGATQVITAEITVSPDASSGEQVIHFRAQSPTSGAFDRIHDAVSVNEVRSIQLTPDNNGQVIQGGAIVFKHTIANLGNVLEGDGTVSDIALTTNDNETGFTSVIYHDTNANGILDPADAAIADLSSISGLAAGSSTTLFVKVFAPSGSPAGTVNVTKLKATTSQGTTYTATAPAIVEVDDTTTVIAGDLEMIKAQGIDGPVIDGTPDLGYTSATINGNPGDIVRYRVIITNTGAAGVTNVVFSDTTPPYTTYHDGTNDTSDTGLASWTRDGSTFNAADSAPTVGGTGTISMDIGNLAPSESVTVYFGVKIDK